MPSDNQLPELEAFSLGNSRLILPGEDSPDFDQLKEPAPPPAPPSLFDALKAACSAKPVAQPPPPTRTLAYVKERPSFIPSEEGPQMGDVERGEPTLGQRMLQELNSAVLSNSIDAESAREMAALVETWQTRLDLAGVGMVAYGVSRVQSVTQMAEDIEQHIWARLADLPVMEAINLLKVLHKDRLAFINLVGSKASSPTISSPEALSGGLSGRAEEAARPRVSMIKPDGRKRLLSVIGKLRKVVNTEVTVVESPT